MLETYMNEIIAAFAILILIVVYFMIKKSPKKQEDVFEESTPVTDKQEQQEVEETTEEEIIKESEPIDSSHVEERRSFDKETINEPLTRVKRTVPPHAKITKDDFKEFAGQKILIAEDNLINQKVITGLLADSGIELTIADDGQIALEILAEDCDYNFILMDAHMPRVDGFEATREIRKISAYNHIVIIALSGDTAADDIKKMSEAGMEEHLEKPLRMDSLYNILYTYAKTRSTDNGSNNEFVEVMITKELDTDKGLSICGDDEEFYDEILNEFVNTYSKSPAKLQELINQKKMQETDQYLLDLSGITANIGANNISNIVINLKEAIINPKDRRYIGLFKEYTKSLHNLLEDIKKYKD